MAARGIRTGFEYLWRPARFPISESVVTYTPSDTYLSAYVVGTANTLWISFLAIVMATFLGLLVALARRSGNPLLSRIVSILSIFNVNIPLLVWLLFWYTIATTTFPAPRDALNPLPGIFFSQRGIYAPNLELAPGGGQLLLLSALIVVAALTTAFRVRRPAVPRLTWLGICILVAVGRDLGVGRGDGLPRQY